MPAPGEPSNGSSNALDYPGGYPTPERAAADALNRRDVKTASGKEPNKTKQNQTEPMTPAIASAFDPDPGGFARILSFAVLKPAGGRPPLEPPKIALHVHGCIVDQIARGATNNSHCLMFDFDAGYAFG